MPRANRANSVDFESCHRGAHWWDTLGGRPLGDYRWLYEADAIWDRCQRCTTVRASLYSLLTGQTEARKYWYPEGYLWDDRENPAPSKADYRLGWLRNVLHRQDERTG